MGIVFPSFVAYVVGCRGLYQAVERHSPTERQDNCTIFGLQYQHVFNESTIPPGLDPKLKHWDCC